ncbi:MAG: FAD-dependent oxidoreductase [Candidatus Latescibacterota bacterium]
MRRSRTWGRARQHVTGDQRTMVPVFDHAGKSSPCRASCPAGHDISGALHLLQRDQFEAAHRLFLEESPFPAVTGRVCYHPCEERCNRREHDEPLAISSLERALADHGIVSAERVAPCYADQPVAVVGSGPAGLTVAYHLTLLGYPVTVWERDRQPGGALRTGIPAYRLPRGVLDAQVARLEALGIQFRCGVCVGRDVGFEEVRRAHAAVFLGLGRPRGRQLGTPGVEHVPTEPGVGFLRAVNEGGVERAKGEVAVIGGGDVAIDCARSALRLGARIVRLYCLEAREEMPAHPEEIRQAVGEGLYLYPGWSPEHFEATAEGRVGICFRQVLRFSPPSPPELGRDQTLAVVDRVIQAIGQEADAPWTPPALWSEGRIAVDAAGATPLAAVFSGGDVAGTYNVVQAIGAGKRAAIGIDCRLRGWEALPLLRAAGVGNRGAVSMRRYRSLRGRLDGRALAGLGDVVGMDRINLDYFPERRRVRRPELSVHERRGFAEVNGLLTREQALSEAQRCFGCAECTVCGNCFVFCPDSAVVQQEDGHFSIDAEHCKGCGICVRECPRAAMTMVVEGER